MQPSRLSARKSPKEWRPRGITRFSPWLSVGGKQKLRGGRQLLVFSLGDFKADLDRLYAVHKRSHLFIQRKEHSIPPQRDFPHGAGRTLQSDSRLEVQLDAYLAIAMIRVARMRRLGTLQAQPAARWKRILEEGHAETTETIIVDLHALGHERRDFQHRRPAAGTVVQ